MTKKNNPKIQMKMKTVTVEEIVNAPASKVWAALTDKDKMRKWFFDLEDFKPEEGFQFTFPGQGHKGESYIHLCKVTEVIPLKKLQYSWQYENFEGYSLVTIELTEENSRTRVKLTHSGLDTFPHDNPDFAPESFNAGWNELITKLLPDFLATDE